MIIHSVEFFLKIFVSLFMITDYSMNYIRKNETISLIMASRYLYSIKIIRLKIAMP